MTCIPAKSNLLTLSLIESKPSVDKIIWIVYQKSNSQLDGCSPFVKKKFNRTGTFFQIIVSQSIDLDDEKLIIPTSRLHCGAKNGPVEDVCQREKTLDEKSYQSDPTDKATIAKPWAFQSNAFSKKDYWYKKTVDRKDGQFYLETLRGNL